MIVYQVMSIVLDSFSDKKLVELLRGGAIGVMPTDTVYGLVCQAVNEDAVSRLYDIKNRESKPGTIIAANTLQLTDLGLKKRYLRAVEQYWPGAVSVVLPLSIKGGEYLHQNVGTVAVRVPSVLKVRDLLLQTGPLLTSSANIPGEKPATSAEEAKKYFKEKVDFYVRGSDAQNGKPSTIIKIVDDAVMVLRDGAVKINERGEPEYDV